ncbi:hypothetical protein [uncultured Clostridium sp.]|nr:hypothetical protein [uncultured Clostridium sp.]
MILLSENIKLSEKDIALLKEKSGGKLISNVITAFGTDDVSISLEKNER